MDDLKTLSNAELADLKTLLLAEIARRKALDEVDVLATFQQAAADLGLVFGTLEFQAVYAEHQQEIAKQLFAALRYPQAVLEAAKPLADWQLLREKLRAISADSLV